MKKENAQQNAGFSLVELLLYISLISLGLLAIVAFADNLASGRVKARTIEEVQQDARFAMHHVSVSFHNATGIDELQTTLDDDDGQIALETDGDTVVYSISDNQLMITEGSNPAEALTSDKTEVTQFLIEDRTPNGDGSHISDAKITITVNHVNPNNAAEFRSSTVLSTTLSLRP